MSDKGKVILANSEEVRRLRTERDTSRRLSERLRESVDGLTRVVGEQKETILGYEKLARERGDRIEEPKQVAVHHAGDRSTTARGWSLIALEAEGRVEELERMRKWRGIWKNLARRLFHRVLDARDLTDEIVRLRVLTEELAAEVNLHETPKDPPTIHKHADGGAVWTLCPECGSNVRVDEDGCCVSCGRDSLHHGRSAGPPGDTVRLLPEKPLAEDLEVLGFDPASGVDAERIEHLEKLIVSLAGGEPISLLDELDECRGERDTLSARVRHLERAESLRILSLQSRIEELEQKNHEWDLLRKKYVPITHDRIEAAVEYAEAVDARGIAYAWPLLSKLGIKRCPRVGMAWHDGGKVECIVCRDKRYTVGGE